MLPNKVEEMPWKIMTKEELKQLALHLGVRDDWHEPDEQGITVEIHGEVFDNAGFWGSHEVKNQAKGFYPGGCNPRLEIWVTILKDGVAVAEVDLATLFAFACDTYDGSEMIPRGYGARTRWSAIIGMAVRDAGKTAIADSLAKEAAQ